jgi:hypothetical protein
MTSRTGLHRSAGAGAFVVLLGLFTVTACSGDDADRSAQQTSRGHAPMTVSAPGAELGTPTRAAMSEDGPMSGSQPLNVLPGEGTALTATGVRAASHSDFDRVVVDLTGTGSPGWAVTMTDHPTADGSGAPVDYTGQEAIVLDVRGIDMNAAARDAAAGRDATPPLTLAKDTGSIGSVKVAGASEGQQRVVIGVAGHDPDLRLNLLPSPTRLVIDIMR